MLPNTEIMLAAVALSETNGEQLWLITGPVKIFDSV